MRRRRREYGAFEFAINIAAHVEPISNGVGDETAVRVPFGRVSRKRSTRDNQEREVADPSPREARAETRFALASPRRARSPSKQDRAARNTTRADDRVLPATEQIDCHFERSHGASFRIVGSVVAGR